ncbi:Zinc finger, CCHC-type [Melia azedarach]|uniref:Zinc finger, CCHC-type n=1 Tax=Melia azedarach TaxID=155640 RepID=A0ACC1X3H9_MELAZ|nr:Zinc finger, CCHC-type [Melia azedarach]
MTSSEEEEEEEEGNESNERNTESEGMIKSKVDVYRKIADLSGFENLKTMMEAEASMPRKGRNKKKRETGLSAEEDANVNVAMEEEQLGKNATLNIVEKEEGNRSEKERRRNERREKSKLDLYEKLNDLSGFENLKAMIEAEASLRTKKRDRKKKGKIELCAQENDNIDVDEWVQQLSEDEALKMVEASKLESLPISKIMEAQNQVIDAAKEDEGGGSGRTLETTGADDVGNSVETTKATGVESGVNSVELEVIDIVSSSSEDDGLVSDVSLGRSVENTVESVLTTKATGADDRVNSVPVIDEVDKSISDVISGRNVENTMPADPVVGEKKRKRRRKKTKIKAKDTTDDAREGDDAKDNIVLRVLLRKPRYFDPPDWNVKTCSICGKENHTAESCNAQNQKKPCFLCGSPTHIWKYCRKAEYL